MRKSFYLAAAICFGSLVIALPITAAARKKTPDETRYYFLSYSKMARELDNTGMLKFLSVDGQDIPYTHVNNTGKDSSKKSKLVWFGFGQLPKEIRIVVNPVSYKAFLARHGYKTPSVLIETKKASRPEDIHSPNTDKNSNNLG